jgi:hypothetical protein
LKINNAAFVDSSDFREPYIGMPIYVDQRDHERYHGRREHRNRAGEILEDLLEVELIGDILHNHNEEAVKEEIFLDQMRGGGTIGEIIQENIEAYCRDSIFESWPVAMAYVPWQSFREVYEPEAAFQAGTIFSDLDLPFLGGGGR